LDQKGAFMAKKCPPVPPRISKAAVLLREGTKAQQSKAGSDMKKHQDKNH
jgi:hypothetical protein